VDEICHKGLARLVSNYGIVPLGAKDLEILVNSSIEPDEMNKKLIAENLTNVLTVPIEWLIDHTIRAKELSINSMKKAIKTRRKKKSSWLKLTGWTFHYITDWGTPHHSFTSKSNPVLTSAGVGAIIGGIIGGITKSGSDSEEMVNGIMKGALAGAGVGGGIGSINLAIKHGQFEKLCDERWESHAHLIKDRYKVIKEREIIPKDLDQALELFERKMDNLRQECNNLPADWIKTSDESEFADYMINIARVMDCAYKIILM
jgi:hypothetical protein